MKLILILVAVICIGSCRQPHKLATGEGFINVDGAKFIESLFSSISQSRLTFDKIKHSVSLCEWIIENSFEDLKDIENTLITFLKPTQLAP